MIDDHDPDKNPRIKENLESVEADMKHDEDQIERIHQQAEEAKKKLREGSQWPD
jgi:hypothetical protein